MNFPFPFRRKTNENAPFERGLRYEKEVCRWLQKEQGFTVLERNYRSGKYEIDIIAKKGNLLVFVEVKSGKEGTIHDPLRRIDAQKATHIRLAAEKYLTALVHEGIDPAPLTVRFDAACVEIARDGSAGAIRYYPAYLEPSDADFRLTL